MTDNISNYFIIERLDSDRESDNLKNIYDLSILDKIKKSKSNNKNKIKIKNSKKIDEKDKENIIQVVKKAILSSNLTYRWKIETFKQILLFFHIFIFFSAIVTTFKGSKRNSLLSMYLNHFNIKTKPNYNISYNINETFNNITNDTEKYFHQNTNDNYSTYNKTDENNNKKYNNIFIIFSLFNQIMLIPVWIIFFQRFIPKWEKVNDIIFKITNYLLYCESLNKGKYCYQLMENFSILIIKKKFYSKYKKLPNELKNQNLLPINMNLNKIDINKNIFSYCISIINDFVLDDFAIVNYQQLISREDLADINILTKYMQNNLGEKISKYTKSILIPMSILLFITLYNNKISDLYFTISLIFIIVNLIIGQHIFKEYYQNYKENIDNFIDNYNLILIQKKRFIYRKDKLILFFCLKSNHYTKVEIINIIKKIIA